MHYDDLKDLVSGSYPAPSEFPVVSLGKTLKPPNGAGSPFHGSRPNM